MGESISYRTYIILKQTQDQLGFSLEYSHNVAHPFSVLFSTLNNVSIREDLGVDFEKLSHENLAPKSRLHRRRHLLNRLYGNRDQNIEAKAQKLDPEIRRLSFVLENQKGINSLESGSSLSVAYEASLLETTICYIVRLWTRIDPLGRQCI